MVYIPLTNMGSLNEFKGKTVRSSNGKEKGTASGHTSRCRMEGCNGVRVSTKWPDGKTTYPCSKGLIYHPDGQLQIG